MRDAGSCCGEAPPPGVLRISVSRGNISRNRIPDNPVSLPAIRLEQDRRVAYADHVSILDAQGNVVAEIHQDDTANPAVWIEAKHRVVATVDGAPTTTRTRTDD